MRRKATAIWQGDLKHGQGALTSESGILDQAAYSFVTRFDSHQGTNPEELLAAAHAGCFAMALSAELNKAGLTADKLQAEAAITLEQTPQGFAITQSHIDLIADIPGAEQTQFENAVNAAKTGCPVSKLFKAEITVSAMLRST